MNLYTIDEDIQLGTQAYEEILSGQPILTSGPEVEMVRRVTDRLVESAIELDPKLEQTPDHIASRFPWEVRVIDDPNTVNAFALPGGKIAVYTGILPVAGDEAGLAVVLGHEIAHATARHGTERLSRNMGFEAVIAILTRGDPNSAELAGIIANLGVGLPFSRKNELQADEIGLLYMANAGYDPRRAVEFWQRMSELSGGAPPELLSTHPSDEHRIEQIRGLLPQALPLYEARAAAAP